MGVEGGRETENIHLLVHSPVTTTTKGQEPGAVSGSPMEVAGALALGPACTLFPGKDRGIGNGAAGI